jgi:hypothetical protein
VPFPTIVNSALTATGVGLTSHDVALPGSRVNGNLLLLFVQTADTGALTGWPSGWQLQGQYSNAGDRAVYARIIDGTEGAVVTLTSPVATRVNAVAVQIGNWFGGSLASIMFGKVDHISTAAWPRANPQITPTWGQQDTLWLCAYMCDSTATLETAPASYTPVNSSIAAGTSQSTVHVYSRELAATIEQPSGWTLSTQRFAMTALVAVRPASAALTKKLRVAVHPSAAGAVGVEGVVYNTDLESIVGAEIGEFSGASFSATTEGSGSSERAVLKVPVTAFNGGSLEVNAEVLVLVRNSTNTTGLIPATIIEE